MHATFLFVLTPEYIDKVADQVKRFETLPHEFERFLRKVWGRDPYPHAQFLEDAKKLRNRKRRGPFQEGGPYYLAHALVNDKECPCFCMDNYLHDIFLERGGLTFREGGDPALAALFKPKSLYKRDFDGEKEFLSALKQAHLPSRCIQDIVMLNGLAGNDLALRPYPGKFPLWIVAAWNHYQGHLTGEELKKLSKDEPDGFFSMYRAALELNESNDEIVDEFLYVRDKVIAAGPDALCIALDGS